MKWAICMKGGPTTFKEALESTDRKDSCSNGWANSKWIYSGNSPEGGGGRGGEQHAGSHGWKSIHTAVESTDQIAFNAGNGIP